MTQRTVRFLGFAADTDANLVISFDGDSYVGPAQSVEPMPVDIPVVTEHDILFTLSIADYVRGNVPMSMTVQSGTVFFGDIVANHASIPVRMGTIDGVFYANLEQWPGNLDQAISSNLVVGLQHSVRDSGPDGFVQIDGNDHKKNPTNDPRWDQVYIDSVLQVVQRPPAGAWIYRINGGSTLTCNVSVEAGYPNITR